MKKKGNQYEKTDNFFGNLRRNLKVQRIPAFIPQAKGRVKRSNRTQQERLMPKLRMHPSPDILTLLLHSTGNAFTFYFVNAIVSSEVNI